jgi:hypothetical protein
VSSPPFATRGRSLLRAALRWLFEPAPIAVAIEVRPSSVGGVRLTSEAGQPRLAAAASVELPKGTIEVSLTEANVIDAAAFEDGLRRLLERIGFLGGGRVGLVLPDPAVRLTLLDLTEKGARGLQAQEEEIRFRLRKSVPFDPRDALVSFLKSPIPGRPALAGLVLRTVLEGYERALERLSCEVGLVEPACLALASWKLAGVEGVDELLVNWDEGYMAVMIARGGWPLLLRTLSGAFTESAESVERELAATLTYHRERLGGGDLTRVCVRCAERDAASALATIARVVSVSPELIDPWGPLRATGDGSLGQAVAGGAALLLRGVA